MNFALFAITTLVWCSTWIAIAMQVGDVPLIVSVFYRFAIAALGRRLITLYPNSYCSEFNGGEKV